MAARFAGRIGGEDIVLVRHAQGRYLNGPRRLRIARHACNASLFSCSVQCRLQCRPLLIPSVFFGFRLPVERATRGCNLFNLGVVGSSSFFKRSFGLRSHLAAAAFRFLGGLLPAAFAIALFLLSCVGNRRLTGGVVVDLVRRRRRQAVLSTRPVHPDDGQGLGERGVLAKFAFEPTARLRTIPGLAIVAAMIAGSSASFAKP